MRSYVLVVFLENIVVGQQFPASNWPLHLTLVPPFHIDVSPAVLKKNLSIFFSVKSPILVIAGEQALFGAKTVTLFDHAPDLQSLHIDLVAHLKQNGATFMSPRYMGNQYRPHVTRQNQNQMKTGEMAPIKSVSLVDRQPAIGVGQRKVLANFKIG